MQPPVEAFKPFSGPPEPLTEGYWLCLVAKRHKYLTFSVQNRYDPSKDPHFRFTIHQVEAKKLGEAILKAATAPVDPTLLLTLVGGVEGVYIGGPVLPGYLLDPSMGLPGGDENLRKAAAAREELEKRKREGA